MLIVNVSGALICAVQASIASQHALQPLMLMHVGLLAVNVGVS